MDKRHHDKNQFSHAVMWFAVGGLSIIATIGLYKVFAFYL